MRCYANSPGNVYHWAKQRTEWYTTGVSFPLSRSSWSLFYRDKVTRCLCYAMNGFCAFCRPRRGQDGHSTRSLPRHFKLSAHSPGAALAYYDSTKDKLLVTKSISLLCQQPYLHAARTFLTNLYKWAIEARVVDRDLFYLFYFHNRLLTVLVFCPSDTLTN